MKRNWKNLLKLNEFGGDSPRSSDPTLCFNLEKKISDFYSNVTVEFTTCDPHSIKVQHVLDIIGNFKANSVPILSPIFH